MMSPVSSAEPKAAEVAERRPRPQVDIDPKVAELFVDPTKRKLGTDYLPPEALERAQKGSFLEKLKLRKDGTVLWREVHELSALLREGKYTWDELQLYDADDIDSRLKWAGLFHRKKRNPGRYMMRMRIPNGIVNSEQLRFISAQCARYGDDGVAYVDVTTRQNFQLRGLKLEDCSEVITGLVERGLGCYSTGLDNIRNLVGNPLAGIDPLEDYDTRQLCKDINDMVSNNNRGNPEWGNLPRKFNIAISGSRDDYAHTHINDIGFQAKRHADGTMGFNVVLGGYMSIKRVAISIEPNLWVPPEEAVNLSWSVLRLFRDHGNRKDRQKARLMWLIEEWGVEKFREALVEEMKTNPVYGHHDVRIEEHQHHHEPAHERRDYLGVHPQKQEGYSWVGLHVPVGRFKAFEVFELARLADQYCGGELRLTVEQNVLLPNVKNENVPALLADTFISSGRFKINPGPLARGLVSCTGAQFCGQALIETKNRAVEIVDRLEAEYEIPQPVRLSWSGCPNQCGQSQIGDIGFVGAPARKDGKAVEGADIYVGGAIGEDAVLGEKFHKNVPMGDEDTEIIASIADLLVTRHGAVKK